MEVEHKDSQLDAEEIAALCDARDPIQIGGRIRELIETGSIALGSRMPPVRDMAASLGVSLGTVAVAWSGLKKDGFIATRGRGGTFVVDGIEQLPFQSQAWPPAPLDLSQASPDPRLQPALEKAVLAGLKVDRLNSAVLDYVIEPLRKTIELQWPFSAEVWTIVGASSESILLCLQATTSPSDKVAVEQPTSPRLLTIMKLLGLEAIGVECDHEGPRVESLRKALDHRPVAFVYQPRGHQPLGIRVTTERAKALADVLRGWESISVIEDDALGPLCTKQASSVGAWLPLQTILVRSYCKAFGLDLRSSVIGGGKERIEKIRNVRSRGLGVTSRILQGALQYLLSDSETERVLSAARTNYASRRQGFISKIHKLGIQCDPATEGLMIWVPVEDEAAALSYLSSKFIQAAAGSQFLIRGAEQHHIAISVGQLPVERSHLAKVAAEVATAATLGPHVANFD